MRMSKTFVAIVAVAPVVACAQTGKDYRLPVDAVYDKLSQTELPDLLANRLDRSGGQVRVEVEPSKTVTWIVSRRDAEMFRFVAHLRAINQGATNVVVEMIAANKGAGAQQAKMLNDDAIIREPFRVAMEEQIASTLEGRDFNYAAVNQAVAAYAVTHIQDIQNSAMKAASDFDKMERDAKRASEDAKIASWNSGGSTPGSIPSQIDAGLPGTSAAPMVDPSRR